MLGRKVQIEVFCWVCTWIDLAANRPLHATEYIYICAHMKGQETTERTGLAACMSRSSTQIICRVHLLHFLHPEKRLYADEPELSYVLQPLKIKS